MPPCSAQKRRRWKTRIWLSGEGITHLGSFPGEVEAARAYDRVAIAHLGPHQAQTNFPAEEYASEWAELQGLPVREAIVLVKQRARADKQRVRALREAAQRGARGGGRVTEAKPKTKPKPRSKAKKPVKEILEPEPPREQFMSPQLVACLCEGLAGAPIPPFVLPLPGLAPLPLGMPLFGGALATAAARRPSLPEPRRGLLPKGVLVQLGLAQAGASRGKTPPSPTRDPPLARPVATTDWRSPRSKKEPAPCMPSRSGSGSGSAETLVDVVPRGMGRDLRARAGSFSTPEGSEPSTAAVTRALAPTLGEGAAAHFIFPPLIK